MTFVDILLLSGKTVICYVFLMTILKWMGKREIGKVSTFDLVVFFVVSELFSLSLNDPKSSIFHSLIPIIIIVLFQLITAIISLKNRKFRKFMEGTPSFLIINGEIDYEAMKKNRYNSDDLLLQLRMEGAITPEEVEFAILESNGKLNVILKKNNEYKDPLPLIQEGKINEQTLKRSKKTLEEIYQIIFENGYTDISEIYLLFIKKEGYYIIPFEKNQKMNDI